VTQKNRQESDAELERVRLKSLRQMAILDSAPDRVLDELTRCVVDTLDVPIALISLVDENRQWFKSNVGLERVTQTPRDVAFCDHTIQGVDLLHVPDARADTRFRNNPLVVSDPNIRFYAGLAIHSADRQKIGSLCAIDRKPRNLDQKQREFLRRISFVVEQWIAKIYPLEFSPGVDLESWSIPINSKQDHVIAAVFDLLAKRGDLTVRAVAQEAGVSLSTLQHRFSSKESLVRASFQAALSLWKANLSQCGSAETLLSTIVSAHASRFLWSMLYVTPGDVSDSLRDIEQTLTEALRRVRQKDCTAEAKATIRYLLGAEIALADINTRKNTGESAVESSGDTEDIDFRTLSRLMFS